MADEPVREPLKMCSVCLAGNYHRCSCPWSKPFADWPMDLLTKIRQQINDAPTPWS